MLNFGCIDFTSSITANMDILGLMKNMHYISALNRKSIQYEIVQGKT